MDQAPGDRGELLGRRLAWATVGANLAGAFLVYLYLQFLAPGAIDVHQRPTAEFVLSAVLVPVYFAAIAVYITYRLRTGLSRWAQCLAEGQALAPDQRLAALALPRQLTHLSAGAWVGAAVLFGALNLGFGNPLVADARIVVGILFGGAVTTAVTFLIAERRYRPMTVLALGGEPEPRRGLGVGGRLLVTWLIGSALPLAAVALTPLGHTRQGLVSLPVSIASLAAIGLIAGFFLTRAAAGSVSEPLAEVRRALESVRGGDLSVEVPVDDRGEIGSLQADVNRMVAGLRERRRLEDLFGRHVGEAVARRALAEPAVLGGHHREVSVLFVDVIGSTALAATRPPDEVVTMLNRLFGCVVEAVTAEGGWVNKFEGDAALCVFGAPAEDPGHAAAALRAARRLRRLLDGPTAELRVLDVAIGVSTGTAVAGNVGAVDRYEYTVIGDPVNEAARLCELAKERPERVVVSGASLEAAGEEASYWERRGEEVLRGRSQPTVIAVPAGVPAGQPPATAGTIETV